MRDVEMSPDGSYFVVATTGGPHSGTLCDTAARFETYAVGTALTPTWTNTSGGDTLWGVEVTQSAVYVGGHNRWMNNPSGSDRAAQGAVPRPGLVRARPADRRPAEVEPGPQPARRGGLRDLRDRRRHLGRQRHRLDRRPALPAPAASRSSPTARATTSPRRAPARCPATSTSAPRWRPATCSTASTPAAPRSPRPTTDPTGRPTTARTSPFHNTGSTAATQSALTAASLVNVPASTPLGIWTQERNDPTGGNEMQWTFPVAAGTSTQVRLYFASRSSSTRRFNVLIDGVTKLTNYDPNVDPGVNKGTMKSFDITSDGTVNIDFAHTTSATRRSTRSRSSTTRRPGRQRRRAWSPSTAPTVGSQGNVSTGTFDWTNVRGAVMVGRTPVLRPDRRHALQALVRRRDLRRPGRRQPLHRPAVEHRPDRQRPGGQTYDGVLPTWYTQLSTVTGMFYANGRIYYTRSGQNSLFWRWFFPDSGIIGGIENTVTGGNITWSSTKGMFLDGSEPLRRQLDQRAAAQDRLRQRRPDRHLDGGRHHRRLARQAPSSSPRCCPTSRPAAAFTCELHRHLLHFDGTSSSDSDGTIASYEWTSATATRPAARTRRRTSSRPAPTP